MLSIGIWQQPYRVIPTLLCSDFGALGHMWSHNDVIMLWLRITATSNCFPHPCQTHTKCLSMLTCCPWAYSSSLMHLYPPYFTQILGLWVTCGDRNDVIMSWLRLTATSNFFSHQYQTYTKCLSTLICCPLAYGSSHTQLYPPYFAQIWGLWVTCGFIMM